MTKATKSHGSSMRQIVPASRDSQDRDLLQRALARAVAAQALASEDVSALQSELAELQAMLEGDGPLASAFELTLLQDIRALLAPRQPRPV